jgi:tripartite-type tricarboxylate transporter receptor subunit TctC
MALRRVVIATDKSVEKVTSNDTITKFIQDQLKILLHNPKLREIVERVSLQENVSKDVALKAILEKMANETEHASKVKKLAASLHLTNVE